MVETPSITETIRLSRLCWFGHVQRMEEHRITRWFKYDQDYLCVNKPVTVPVIFEPPCACAKLTPSLPPILKLLQSTFIKTNTKQSYF